MSARRRALGLAAFGAAAAAGAAVGFLAERRRVGSQRDAADPEWAELGRPVHGHPGSVSSRDGTRLHVEVLGPDTAPTIVMAHGYVLSQHFWHYQRRDLPPDFRVVAYDQRGHAASAEAVDGDYSLHALADDLAAVVTATVPVGSPAVLVGHSMGGMAVMALADRYPELVRDRVAGVVLVSTGASHILRGTALSLGVAALGGLEQALAIRALGAPGAFVSDLSFLATRGIGLSRHASPAQVAFVEHLAIACPNPVRAALAQTLATVDLRHALRVLSCPALVMVGDRDRMTPLHQSRALADALPDARLVEVPGVGHSLPLEAHETVTAHVRAFARRSLDAVASAGA
jgi:pimeloyl-ACP methyl ester carboxylesterase